MWKSQHIDLRKELDMDEYSILSIPGIDTDDIQFI